MPALITHYLCAKKSLDLLSDKGFDINREVYLWGAQGPDFFFYHKPLGGERSLRNIGSILHKADVQQVFTAFRDYTELCGIKDVRFVYSYCFGFLSHLALDSGAHPYVYFFQDILAEKLSEKANFMHHKIEHNIDVIMLAGLEKRKVINFKIKEALPSCARGLKAAAKAVEFMVNEVSPDTPVSYKEIYSAFKDFKKYSGFLLSRRGRRRHIAQWLENKHNLGVSLSCFVRPEEPENDFDYMNINAARWLSKGTAGGRPSSAGFLDLFDKAVENGAYLAERFKDCADHRQPIYFLKDYRFDNGTQKLEVRQWSE